MAALGGALYGASQHSVTSDNFIYIQSLFLLLIVYIWGIKSPSGALLGGLFYASFPLVTPHLPERWAALPYLLTGFGIIGLARFPNGVIGQWSGAWEDLRARLGVGGKRRVGASRPSGFPSEEVSAVAVATD
jgi:ABC-type branched-subunit amino acid transport system permease subunit